MVKLVRQLNLQFHELFDRGKVYWLASFKYVVLFSLPIL